MGKTEENDKSKLELKNASKPGGPFEIHSLNNFREVGNYTWIAREMTDEMGFPDCVKETDDCHYCEGQLFVMRHGAEEICQSTDTFGQVLTIINHETGATNIYTRAVHPLDSDEWTPWQMVATGDPKLITENNSINEGFSNVNKKVSEEIARAILSEQLLHSEIGNVGLPLGYTLIDTYESTDYNISRKLHLFNIEAGAELKIKIELSEPLRREDDVMYIFLRDSDGITIDYIGEIKSGEQSKEKTIEFSRSYKNAFVLYSLAYSKDYTITTTIDRINTLQQQLSKVNNEVAELNRDITNINASLKEYKALEKIETKIGFIAANGTLNNTVTYLSVDYYNAVQGELWYKASSEVLGGLEGVYLIHFFDASGRYLGHSEARDISIKDYVFSVPEETSVITITCRGSKKSNLSVLLETSEGITERIVSLEKSLLLKKKSIVAFGDSITAMTDDDSMSYIDYVSEITGATVYNAGIPGSRLSISEECVFIKIKSKATADGEVTVNGAVRSVSFTALATDSMEDLAVKLFNAYKSISSTLAYNVSGNEVAVRNWSGFTAPINVNNIVCETNTGVTIEVRKNKYGMFESFTSTYMAYSNLDIPHMVYGLISGDWRCQMLAAEYLVSQNITGMVEKISALQALSIDDIDIVTIAGGTNNFAADWGANDSNNTAYLSGGINEIIQILLLAKPTLRVAFFTPIPRYFGNSITNWDDSMWGDNYVKNEHNGVMPALVEKISEVVKRNHIPVYDMYYSIGWNRWNFVQFFNDSDGTHPKKGLKWMGERIAGYLKSML